MKQQYFYGKLPEKITGIRRMFVSFISRKTDIDGESVKLLEEHRGKGTVVFATYHTSNIALAFLYNLLQKYSFGLLSYAFDYDPVLLQSPAFIFRKLFKNPYFMKRNDFFSIQLVKGIIERGEMMVFSVLSGSHFLKRYMDPLYDTLYNLIELQKNEDKPIIVIPQMVFWHRKPEKTGGFFIPRATGKRGLLGGFLSSFSPTYLHFLKPVYLDEFISMNPDETSEMLAIRLRDQLLEAHDREKRLVLGPVLTPRQEMMEQILYHDNVQSVIKQLAEERKKSEQSLKRESYRNIREIASDYKISYVLFFERILDWMFKKIFRGIRMSDEFIRTMREAAEKGPVIIVPNHRSHMDYLIVSYIFYKNRIMPPHIAAGVNLSFFPVGNLFRHSGAFFIRRTFRNLVLYPAVFKQYLKTLIHKRYHIEYFLEGGRSRTGRLLYPKPGLTSFIIEAVEEGYADDVTFLPVSICYDRVLEEHSYVKEMKGHSKEKENMSAVLKARKFLKKEYGFVYVNNGTPFTLSAVNSEVTEKSERVGYIGRRIMKEISSVVTVTPLNLVSAVMLCQSTRGIKKEMMLSDIRLIYNFLLSQNRCFSPVFDESDLETVVETVLARLVDENLIERLDEDDVHAYLINESGRVLLSYYKNPIMHYLRYLVLLLNAVCRNAGLTVESAVSHVDRGQDLLSQEFPVEQSAQEIENTVEFLRKEKILVINGSSEIGIADTSGTVERLSGMLQDLFESNYLVCNVLELADRKAMESSVLVKSAYERGRALLYSDKIRFPESLSKPSFINALRYISLKGHIEERDLSRRRKQIRITDRKALSEVKKEFAEWFIG